MAKHILVKGFGRYIYKGVSIHWTGKWTGMVEWTIGMDYGIFIK